MAFDCLAKLQHGRVDLCKLLTRVLCKVQGFLPTLCDSYGNARHLLSRISEKLLDQPQLLGHFTILFCQRVGIAK